MLLYIYFSLFVCRYLCGDSRGGIQCYYIYISLCLFAGICVVILVVGFNVTVDIFLSACLQVSVW